MEFSSSVERMPPQVARMQEAIDEERNIIRADCLRAEQATLLARHGFAAEASSVIAELRHRYESHAHPAVAIWINLADGIVANRGARKPLAVAKLRRAQALAAASENAPMQALTAAWLAHVSWNLHDVDAAVAHARQALRLARPDDHKARARVCLVVGEILALCRHESLAKRWFASARRHAVAGHDDASKSALSFNLGSINTMLLRQAKLSSIGDANARQAELHRAVSANVDAALGIPDDRLALMERAMVLSLLDRPRDALDIYARQGGTRSIESDREWSRWLSDEAWCWSRVGELDHAATAAEAAERAFVHTTQLDDVAVFHSLMAEVRAVLGDASASAGHRGAANAAWAQYAAYQAYCGKLCEPITEEG